MLKFGFKKLVRDKIVQRQQAQGCEPLYWQLSHDEHVQHLIKKVIEETQEIAAAPKHELAAEIADAQQALDDLRHVLSVSAADVRAEQAKKNTKYGAFVEGLYVEHVLVPEDNEWVEHFRENPDRYPELEK
jgi:predicted house-cleaning noncanonical NTP pyrophosphatase (MazG superfamily)